MSEDEPAITIERRSPEDTFGLLGDETRIQILRAFQEAELSSALSFSELRDIVGTRDSGQFNYHLKKLTGHFIRKTEEGYELTMAGGAVLGALLSGTYTATAEMEPLELSEYCVECGSRLRMNYESETVRIFCTDCGETHGQFMVPPGTLEQFDREELPMAVNRWIRSEFAQAVAGFCPNCSGRLAPSITVEEDNYLAVFDCDRCGGQITSSVAATLLFSPEVIAFAYENGIDTVETPYWDLDWIRKGNTKVRSTDPLRLRVRISIEGEILDVTVDEGLRVLEAVRQ